MLVGIAKIDNVHVTSDGNQEKIRIFLQGAVYDWCKNQGDKPFACRDLMGGVNKNWENTPMQALYDYHDKTGVKNPYNEAAKSAGRLLKQVLFYDKNKHFKKCNSGRVAHYIWVS